VIANLSVQNFKSIKNLNLKCKRVNLFIGEPNTGKSNILEALGLLSWCSRTDKNLKDFVRFQNMYNIFYDNLIDNQCSVTIRGTHERSVPSNVKLFYSNNLFNIHYHLEKSAEKKVAVLDYSGRIMDSVQSACSPDLDFVKYYKFKNRDNYPDHTGSFLVPPDGPNLFTLVMGNAKLRESMKSFFTDYNLKLVLKPVEMSFEVQKEEEDLIFNYPYQLLSDTLRHIIFYSIAIDSNENSTLIFEEPEAHAFPYYTKWLGEKIAMNRSNQFFIATHNPYMLQAIMEKTDKPDINVCITCYRDYQTQIYQLTPDQIEEAMNIDPFFNLSRFLPVNE
jgi:AAA15 family ATPase/GTPase